MLVTVEIADGTVGVGEGAPIPPVTGETQDAAIETTRTLATVGISGPGHGVTVDR